MLVPESLTLYSDSTRQHNADDEAALVGSIVIKQKNLLTLTNLCEVEGNVRNR